MTVHPIPITLSLLLVAALGAAESAPADLGRASPSTILAEAQRLQAARDPRVAIKLYTQVIERDPADIAVSAPALSGLIACHQMLAGDAALAESYRTTVGRWLDHPPALDGKSTPAPAELREDLLWAQLRSPTWRVQGISSGSRTETNGDTTVSKTTKGITLTVMGQAGGAAKPKSSVPGSTLMVSVGGRRIDVPVSCYGSNTGPDAVSINLEWEDQPGVQHLDRIEGVIRLQQPLEVKDKEFPLVKGTELEFVDGKATLSDVDRDGDNLDVRVEWKRKVKPGQDVTMPDPNEAVTILLKTASGELLTPVSQGMGSSGSDGRMRLHRNLTFTCDSSLEKLVGVVRTVATWSHRDIPVLVEHVDLTRRP